MPSAPENHNVGLRPLDGAADVSPILRAFVRNPANSYGNDWIVDHLGSSRLGLAIVEN